MAIETDRVSPEQKRPSRKKRIMALAGVALAVLVGADALHVSDQLQLFKTANATASKKIPPCKVETAKLTGDKGVVEVMVSFEPVRTPLTIEDYSSWPFVDQTISYDVPNVVEAHYADPDQPNYSQNVGGTPYFTGDGASTFSRTILRTAMQEGDEVAVHRGMVILTSKSTLRSDKEVASSVVYRRCGQVSLGQNGQPSIVNG